MSTARSSLFGVFIVFILMVGGANAAIPLVINHQGSIEVGGSLFTGTGQFRFAIVDPDSGNNLWTNDGTELGTANMPSATVGVAVIEGIYSVGLGDAALTNMVVIPSTVFDDDNVELRIWFDDGTNGVSQLSPDDPLTSAPYAFRARAVDGIVYDEGLPSIILGGTGITASGDNSTAMGINTTASGSRSTAMGFASTASGIRSTAMGQEIEAAGDLSVAIALNDQNGTVVANDNTMAIMGGNVGIGSVTPTTRLHVEDNVAGFVISVTNDGDSADRDGIVIQAGADNELGITDYLLARDGDGDDVGALRNDAGTFGLVTISDRKTKTNIRDTEVDALGIIEGLRVVDFNRKALPDGPTIHGFIAQEAQEVFPEMVTQLNEEMLGISKDTLIPILTKAMQEQQKEIARLRALIEK